MYSDVDEIINYSDLYSVSSAPSTPQPASPPSAPFIHRVQLAGPNGELVRIKILVDDGAMVGVMCAALWERVRHRLGDLQPSSRRLRMANGAVEPSRGRWVGDIVWEGVRRRGAFEVFPSGGAWSFLFGKLLLHQFGAIHNYRAMPDTIAIQGEEGDVLVSNQFGRRVDTQPGELAAVDIKAVLPDRQNLCRAAAPERDVVPAPAPATPPIPTDCAVPAGSEPVWHIGPDVAPMPGQDAGEPIPDMYGDGARTLYCRRTDPFNAARVSAVVDAVRIGSDLAPAQRDAVSNLVREFADCFALSVGEVLPVPGAEHRLNVPDGATFSRKVHQKSLSPPQRAYLHQKIDEMLEAGVIAPCDPADVKCVSPITLAQKAHDGGGLSLEELQHRVNDLCVAAGMEPMADLPPRPAPVPAEDAGGRRDAAKPAKWRICQNFAQINKVTQVAPMPQGDIRAKQQALCGHRWICSFDFASGFYAVTVAEESRPYTAFYVEGRGYFWCIKMPFGLTGAPSTFAKLTADHLHDLLSDGTMELFVDDGATAGDDFDALLARLRWIFVRVRERGLSLSAAKSEFFVTETVFAGATVGPKGVTPDLAKLTAIVDWEQPLNALILASFLGVTGYFRDLIKGYARIEGPLRDLLKAAEPPRNCSKAVYRRTLQAYVLDESRWTARHTEAFLTLKRVLTSEPVLRRPRWDGTPFIVTSDGCKDGFGAVLMQRFETVLPSGKTVSKLHPIAFASKRTSKSEERYKPFLLEFAALKYALDKFSSIIWGFPIEIETDCSALRYVLTNDKLNDTHARWRDSVLGHQIVDVRHIPGRTNVVGDGISRRAEGLPRHPDDGSAWSVCEDWETRQGLVNDIFAVAADSSSPDPLATRFAGEPMFLEVIQALQDRFDEGLEPRARQRALHRSSQYLVADGRLWRLRGSLGRRARARVECLTQSEAKAAAFRAHVDGGHWGRDLVKLHLLDRCWAPGLDKLILDAIGECGHCKNFGSTHLHSLMDPITRRHPFELLVGDYLSLPAGRGGFHTLGVFVDVFARFVWVFKFRAAGSGKTTVQALTSIGDGFLNPETFMSDGGSHFDNQEVRNFCASRGIDPRITAAYAPWINGLVEGTNKLLIQILKRLCAPGLGEDDYTSATADSLPKNWPLFLDEAVRCLNSRILPSLGLSPRELLFGLAVNTPRTPAEVASLEPSAMDADIHLAYAEQQRLDGYDATVRHARARKAAFDRRVRRSRAGPVAFATGDLVQVYRSDLDYTFRVDRKLLPKWSEPRRVVACTGNSYVLETLSGESISGLFHARRLRSFTPRPGTRLALDEARRPAAVHAPNRSTPSSLPSAPAESRLPDRRSPDSTTPAC